MRLRASTLTAKHWSDQAMSTSHKRQRQSITVLVWRLESSDTFQEISFFIWSQSQLESQG